VKKGLSSNLPILSMRSWRTDSRIEFCTSRMQTARSLVALARQMSCSAKKCDLALPLPP
jgi:hypothetical protein